MCGRKRERICFGHTLEDQIEGQITAGFYEDIGGTAMDAPMNGSIAIRAVKP